MILFKKYDIKLNYNPKYWKEPRIFRDSNFRQFVGGGFSLFIGRPDFCEGCGEPYYGYGCEDCCEHEPDADEGFHCLLCGKDCSEDVQSRAYDRAKDLRKYGRD